MRKLLILLLWLLTLLSFAQQAETFHGITYSVPAGWKNTIRTTGVSAFSFINNQTGAYALIAIYAVTPTRGNVHLDFKRQWEALVAKPYGPTEDPTVVPTEFQDGWTAKCGTVPIEFSGSMSAAMLIVVSGYGKCVSVVVVTNSTDYQASTSEFLESLDISELADYDADPDYITQPSGRASPSPSPRSGIAARRTPVPVYSQ